MKLSNSCRKARGEMRVKWSVEKKEEEETRHFLDLNIVGHLLFSFLFFLGGGRREIIKHMIYKYLGACGETHWSERNQRLESGQPRMSRNSCSKFVATTWQDHSRTLNLAVAAHNCAERPTAPNLGGYGIGFKALCLYLFK